MLPIRNGCILLTVVAASVVHAQAPSKKSAVNVLGQFNEAVQELCARVTPSVVQVVATSFLAREDMGDGRTGAVLGREQHVGSGVIVTSDGYIVTNAHVVSGAQRVKVSLLNQRPDVSRDSDEALTDTLAQAFAPAFDASVVGLFKEADLALLKIAKTGLPTLPFADYKRVRQGEVVFAIGNRNGLSGSVSMGVVSSVARQPDPDSPFIFIQTDAAINPGDSGGPLVNTNGEVVGLNTFIITQSGGSEGIGFAIPSALVQVVADQLRKQGHFHRLTIGVGVQAITAPLASALHWPQQSGVVISDVLPGSPAEAAGLRLNDQVLAIDGKAIENVPNFMMSFLTHKPGTPVDMKVARGGERLNFNIAATEEAHASDRLIDKIDPVANRVARLGIVGVSIDESKAALLPAVRAPLGVYVLAKAQRASGLDPGLQVGDLIHEVNGASVSNIQELRAVLDKVKLGDSVAIFLEREGKFQYVAFQME